MNAFLVQKFAMRGAMQLAALWPATIEVETGLVGNAQPLQIQAAVGAERAEMNYDYGGEKTTGIRKARIPKTLLPEPLPLLCEVSISGIFYRVKSCDASPLEQDWAVTLERKP